MRRSCDDACCKLPLLASKGGVHRVDPGTKVDKWPLIMVREDAGGEPVRLACPSVCSSIHRQDANTGGAEYRGVS
jgi:hypothetical protein